jgi:lipid-binding SYLF domain-containing protein
LESIIIVSSKQSDSWSRNMKKRQPLNCNQEMVHCGCEKIGAKLSSPNGKVTFRVLRRPKTAVLLSLTCLVLIISTPPVRAADRGSDEETLSNATTVLGAMIASKDVPGDVLAKANCVIVLPSVKKFAIGVGGSGGRGPMVCRGGKDFSGRWSAPAMFTIGGASAGFQVGGSSTDFILLIMSAAAVNKVTTGKTKVGRDMTAAAGPNGATSSGAVGGTDILTYGRAKGLFAGMSLSGASLEPDSDANQRLYGKAVSASDILLVNAVKVTPGGQSLLSLLNSKVVRHKN